jgi:hypothetical protein
MLKRMLLAVGRAERAAFVRLWLQRAQGMALKAAAEYEPVSASRRPDSNLYVKLAQQGVMC